MGLSKKPPEYQKMGSDDTCFLGALMSREEAEERLARYGDIDYTQFYIDGRLSIKRVIELDYGFLISAFSLDKNGKLVDFKLHGNTAAYIYLIRAANGLVKIGLSSDVSRRFSQIDSASPVALELLRSAFVSNAPDLERLLHKMFSKKRQRGEWFLLNDEDVKLALRVLAEHEV